MPVLNQAIAFKFGLQANYDSITTKDVNTAYFTTDKQRMFIGDVEYSRPVGHGTSLPTSLLPPDSLYVVETNDRRELYYSKDGASWDKIAVLPAEITGGVFGSNTTGTVAAGGTIIVPKLTVDEYGFITAVEDVSMTLPASVSNTVTLAGTGNAVTDATFDSDGHALTLTKGETFVTQETFNNAIAGITQIDYQVVAALPATGEKGIIYLVADNHTDESDNYDEYLWTGTAFEKIGNTDVDLSGYVPTTRTINGQALTADVTITDITGNAGTADALKTARTIAISGAVTGTATSFDGSADITIPTTSVDGTKVTGVVPEATKATQDGSGNVITDTYATKTELTNSALVWGTF